MRSCALLVALVLVLPTLACVDDPEASPTDDARALPAGHPDLRRLAALPGDTAALQRRRSGEDPGHDGQPEGGLSCLSCHPSSGIGPRTLP